MGRDSYNLRDFDCNSFESNQVNVEPSMTNKQQEAIRYGMKAHWQTKKRNEVLSEIIEHLERVKHKNPNHPRGVGYNEGLDNALVITRAYIISSRDSEAK